MSHQALIRRGLPQKGELVRVITKWTNCPQTSAIPPSARLHQIQTTPVFVQTHTSVFLIRDRELSDYCVASRQ